MTDPMSTPDGSTRPTSISVCMIARDEAKNLGSCLKSTGDLSSEIIVVDTGSTDDTVEIAEALGARVYHFDWTGDFSAARNESLRHATKEWVFWLDADDRLTPDTVRQLKQYAAPGLADAYICPVASGLSDGSRSVTEHVRLFRNGLGITFQGVIHESVLPDLLRMGLRVARIDAVIEHTGYESPETLRRKSRRNLEMIEAELSRDPHLVDMIFYRAQARQHIGDIQGSEVDMHQFLQLTQPSASFNWMRFSAYMGLVHSLEGQNRSGEIESFLLTALREFPGHPTFLAMLGRLYLSQGKPQVALPILLNAHEASLGPVRGHHPTLPALQVALAECYRALGHRSNALLWAEKASGHPAPSDSANLLTARLLVEAGELARAEGFLSAIGDANPTVEYLIIQSELSLRRGKVEEARRALSQARDKGMATSQVEDLLSRVESVSRLAAGRTCAPASIAEADRQMAGFVSMVEGRHLEAAELFAGSIQIAPANPDNYRYLAVALKAMGREDEAMEAWRLADQRQTRAVRSWPDRSEVTA